jgi:histidyl-tRNA synthetase
MQFDADMVGTDNVAADAETCMLAADAMEALGIKRGDYVIRVNSRKVLDGVMDAAEISQDKRLTVLRAIDKYDRLGIEGVRQLLGKGRKDESGDFTPGAELEEKQIEILISFLKWPQKKISSKNFLGSRDSDTKSYMGVRGTLAPDEAAKLEDLRQLLKESDLGVSGVNEVEHTLTVCRSCGFRFDQIRLDETVVRGLEYYTGLVFEAELTFEVADDDGQPVRFGSVGGGGRYDGLVSRFKGADVPATGFSIGVSRLYAALKHLGKIETGAAHGPVVVLVMDHDRTGDYARMTQTLRSAGIRAEMYVGTSGMKAQMKYADKRAAPCVVIQGEDERARGEVQIKDLIEGAKLSEEIADNVSWREGRPAQFSVPEAEMVEAVQSVLARYA